MLVGVREGVREGVMVAISPVVGPTFFVREGVTVHVGPRVFVGVWVRLMMGRLVALDFVFVLRMMIGSVGVSVAVSSNSSAEGSCVPAELSLVDDPEPEEEPC